MGADSRPTRHEIQELARHNELSRPKSTARQTDWRTGGYHEGSSPTRASGVFGWDLVEIEVLGTRRIGVFFTAFNNHLKSHFDGRGRSWEEIYGCRPYPEHSELTGRAQDAVGDSGARE
jgi:hypothetical protein